MSQGSDWDPEYAMLAGNDLLPRLAAEAIGPDYPAELRPYGFTTRTLLREIGSRLELHPGGTVLDLGTGEGGLGLWLAAEHDARLVALDFSTEALRNAARLAAALAFDVDVDYRRASFTATGLTSATVDAVMCLDAMQYCTDKPAALREVHRVLRPGGRLALTAPVGPLDVPDYRPLAEAGGLTVVHHAEVRGWREPTRRTFELWQTHADELRAQLGDAVTTTLLEEAAEVLPKLDARRYVLLVAAKL